MKRIELVNGKGVALVSDEDYKRLRAFRWYNVRGYARRVVRHIQLDDRLVKLWRYMHQDVYAFKSGGSARELDHINGNKLDNRRNNLREVTRLEQMSNWHGPTKRSSSGVLGVHWDASRHQWGASIMRNGRKRFKRFATIEAATQWRQIIEATTQVES